MNNKVLVTFASRTGTTAGVADAIGKTFSDKGFPVDVLKMDDVKDISQYGAVIAGSAIQASKWLPEAIDFLKENSEEMSKKPCAVFHVCMTLAMKNGEKYRPTIYEWVQPVRDLVRPVSEGFFAGRLIINSIPGRSDRLKFRISVLLGVWKEGDHRNWDEINKWAEDLIPLLSK